MSTADNGDHIAPSADIALTVVIPARSHHRTIRTQTNRERIAAGNEVLHRLQRLSLYRKRTGTGLPMLFVCFYRIGALPLAAVQKL